MAATIFLVVGMIYSLVVSWLAFRHSGQKWMLFFPQWLDPKCGVPGKLRFHGFIAFALLSVGVALLLA